MKTITTEEAYKIERELKNRILFTIRKKIGNKKIELQDLAFEDEANNTITAFDKENVYFDGVMESYPLGELGLLDAIYILGELK